MDLTLLLALLTGVGIAAACGLRAFLPLLVLGTAARLGWVDLADGMEWLASTPALTALAAATVVELAGDKLPAVDHVLDVLGTVLRPAAACVGVYAALVEWPAPWGQLLAVLLGGGALVVHGLKAKLRLTTSAATLGQGNPWLSAAEDVTAAVLLAAALAVPVLILVALVSVIWAMARRRRRAALGRA